MASVRNRRRARFGRDLFRLDDRIAPAVLSFQQGVAGYEGTTDTDLFSLDANTNFADNTFISVDQQDFDNVHHGLLRFADIFTDDPISNPGKIPFGSVINSATLTLSIINESNQAALLSLYRMKTDWNESVATWNTFGPVGGIQTDGVEAEQVADFTLGDTATTGLKDLDVLTSVQAWSNGIDNHGWAVIQYSSNGWDMETSEAATNQPKLVVDFTPPAGAGSLTFTQPNFTIVEGDAGAAVAQFLVARQGGNVGTVSVDYEITAGTATAGVDYDNASITGTLTFGPTDVFLPIAVPIIGDTAIEGTERFTITLKNATGGATLGKTPVATAVIADQDVLINEVVANISGQADDGYEYIELIGTPGASLNGLQVVIFEGESEEAGGVGGPGGGVGVADLVVDLTGQTIGSNGIFVITATNWNYTPGPGTNQLKITALDKVGGGIEDSSLTVAILKGPSVLTVGTDYDLDVVPAVPNNDINVGVINLADPLFGYDILDSVGWTEMGGSDADRNIGYTVPGVRLNQPQAQIPADSGGTSSDAGSRRVGDKTPNNIGSWFNGDIKSPAIPVAYDSRPRANVNNPAGASVTPGDVNTQRVVSFLVSSYKVEEKSGSATITVDRIGDTTGSTSVSFTTLDGTAKAGSDYVAQTGSISFSIGETSKPIVVTINNDGVAEGFESFSVQLTAVQSPFLIATTTASIRIEDADAKFAAFQDIDTIGGYDGTRDAGIYGWKADTAFGSDLTVQVDQADANLITDPLRPTQGMLRFDGLFGAGPGQIPVGSTILNAFITLNVVNPSSAQAQVRFYALNHDWDQFAATWQTPTTNPGITNGVFADGVQARSTPDAIVPNPGQAGPVDIPLNTDTIQAWANGAAPNFGWQIINDVDDDWIFVSSEGIDAATRPLLTIIYTDPTGAGTFGFARPEFEVTEAGGTGSLTVLRSGATTGTVNVNWSITGGTALPADYTGPTSGTLNFGPTDTFKTISLGIVNDAALEANETIEITLTSAGQTFTRAVGTLVIRDNDFNAANPAILINELQTNSIGQDQPYEYVEFVGGPGVGAGSLYFVSIEGDNNNYLGTNEFAHDLGRLTTGANGLILVRSFFGGHANPDPATTISRNALLDTSNTNALRGFDSDHTSSYLLIYSPNAALTEFYDFDWDNDGTLDLPAGAVIVDAVGQFDNGGGDIVYGEVSLPLPPNPGGGAPIYVPDQISRFVGNTDAKSVTAWFYGDHLGTDDALVYNPLLSTGLPVAGATATPGQINAQASTPLAKLTSVTIGDGSAQRSMVSSITLNFDRVVDRLLTGGIELTNDKGAPIAGVSLAVAGINTDTWTITFSGSPIVAGSLPDGLYRLTIDGIDLVAAGRTVDANNSNSHGSVRTVDFHRLAGDANGDRSVGADDFLAFRLAFLSNSPTFDFDNNGTVDAADFLTFRLQFLKTI